MKAEDSPNCTLHDGSVMERVRGSRALCGDPHKVPTLRESSLWELGLLRGGERCHRNRFHAWQLPSQRPGECVPYQRCVVCCLAPQCPASAVTGERGELGRLRQGQLLPPSC